MPAHRRYSDEQRAAIHALWTRGVRAAEISRQCRLGLAAVQAFEIPRRTVQSICSAIDRERGTKRPHTPKQAATPEAIRDFPRAVLQICHEELLKIEAKQPSGQLTATDLERIDRLFRIWHVVADVQDAHSAPPRRTPRPATNGEGGSGGDGFSPLMKRIERAARERGATPAGPVPAGGPVPHR